jgi:pantoate--beta-alanine ligase
MKAREAYVKGGERDGKALQRLVVDQIAAEAPAGRVDYVEVVDAATLQTPTETTELVLIAVAVFFGSARLIDNIELK